MRRTMFASVSAGLPLWETSRLISSSVQSSDSSSLAADRRGVVTLIAEQEACSPSTRFCSILRDFLKPGLDNIVGKSPTSYIHVDFRICQARNSPAADIKRRTVPVERP